MEIGVAQTLRGDAVERRGRDPPKVLGAAKPTSSVMINRMFGAPSGGTTVGGHQGFDWAAFRLISPPNGNAGGGRTSPVIVRDSFGEPGTPRICGSGTGGVGPGAGLGLRPPASHDPLNAVNKAAFAVDRNNWTPLRTGCVLGRIACS